MKVSAMFEQHHRCNSFYWVCSAKINWKTLLLVSDPQNAFFTDAEVILAEKDHLLEIHLLEKSARHQNLDCSTPSLEHVRHS